MKEIQLKKCTLPETNYQHYLTAITALNIFSEDGTGDWHFSENFLEDESYIPRKTVAAFYAGYMSNSTSEQIMAVDTCLTTANDSK